MPPTRIYTLSLHDALPISFPDVWRGAQRTESAPVRKPDRKYRGQGGAGWIGPALLAPFVSRRRHPPSHPGKAADRKSTRLNSSHMSISYAVFCLKKKSHD